MLSRGQINTEGLQKTEGEGITTAQQTARPSRGSDDQVNGGTVSRRRRENGVLTFTLEVFTF